MRPWYVDNVRQRFEAYGWDVIGAIDGQDVDAVDAALTQARKSATRPTLIICNTTIGKGSPHRAGTAKAHGEALGSEEVALTREALGWNWPPFVIPEQVYGCGTTRRAATPPKATGTRASPLIAAPSPSWRPNCSAACAASCRRTSRRRRSMR